MPGARVVDLVRADLQPRNDYREAIHNAIVDVRWWYRQQVGRTFTLRREVELVRASQNAAWFTTHSTGGNADGWHFSNALREANAKVRATTCSDSPAGTPRSPASRVGSAGSPTKSVTPSGSTTPRTCGPRRAR